MRRLYEISELKAGGNEKPSKILCVFIILYLLLT